MMRTLLTGASGYIGGATLTALLRHGHEVVAAVRSAEAAAKVEAAGATPALGSLGDREWLTDLLAASDGAIHIAHPDPIEDYDAVLDAADAAYSGTGRPLISTSGVWMYGNNPAITEDEPLDPPALVAARLPREERLLAADYRGAIVLASVVYGNGAGLIPGALLGSRTDEGAVRLIGDGSQHWATVHVDDLADLYVLLLETDAARGRYVAASGTNPTVREIAEAAGAGVVAETAEEARGRFGVDFADAILLDQRAFSPRAGAVGWEPSRPTVLDDIVASR